MIFTKDNILHYLDIFFTTCFGLFKIKKKKIIVNDVSDFIELDTIGVTFVDDYNYKDINQMLLDINKILLDYELELIGNRAYFEKSKISLIKYMIKEVKSYDSLEELEKIMDDKLIGTMMFDVKKRKII